MSIGTPSRTVPAKATRTTLALGNDVLILIRQRAELTGQTMGEAASDLIRESVNRDNDRERRVVNGILLLPDRDDRGTLTMETVNELRDEWP
ncbi:MAG: hypothetical protein QM589_07160 [Thermomicrobiales bacterium]